MVRSFLTRIMAGRYGTDQLNLFLLIIYLALIIVEWITRLALFYWIALVFLIISFLRCFSRQLDRRRAENDYKVNLKTEIMIEDLYDKVNVILAKQLAFEKHLAEKGENK